MLVNQAPDRVKKLVGYNCETGVLCNLPLCCVRKPPKEIPRYPYFCFISNPLLVAAKNIKPFMWLHCYRDESCLPTDAPRYLFPESDCVDKVHSPIGCKTIKYDYAYFTISGAKGNMYKGLDNFMRDIKKLDELHLRGIVIFYNGVWGASSEKINTIQKHNVVVWSNRVSRDRVAKVMSQTRFGFFPNKFDCSPRMIPEYFLQNRPAIVNEGITGGWHYFSEPAFGSLYRAADSGSLIAAVEHVMQLPNNQRTLWESNYGFAKGTRRLADLIRKHYPCDEVNNSTHVYFREYRKVFVQSPEMFV